MIDAARHHHHERIDGTGCPDRLAGDAIPRAARLIAIGDTDEALRSRRPYPPALPHEAAVRIISKGSPGRFEPSRIGVFDRCAGRFSQTYREYAGP